MSQPWIPKNFDEVFKRAAGRRRYHAQRRQAQRSRQLIVMAALVDARWQTYGCGRPLARLLSVHAGTISRDIQFLSRWRAEMVQRVGQEYADQIIGILAKRRAHPKNGYAFRISLTCGLVWVES